MRTNDHNVHRCINIKKAFYGAINFPVFDITLNYNLESE